MYMRVNKGKLGFQGKFYWQTNFENFIFLNVWNKK